MSLDLYGALGVDRDATPADINSAYRRAAKSAHPDAGGSPETFALVRTAKDILGDEKRRAKYDLTGKIDDVGPDNTETDAMQVVMQAVMKAISMAESRNYRVEEFDIVSDAIRLLRECIRGFKNQEAQHTANAKKQRKLAKKFEAKKGKNNLISPMFEGQGRQMDEAAAKSLEPVATHERAIEILMDHTFKTDRY